MPAPNVEVQVEPFESGKVVFLPMAPATAGAKARGRVFLRLDITNHEAETLAVEGVTVSFPGESVPAETKAVQLDVGAGQTSRWWFQQPGDDVVFDLPGPSCVKLAVHCQGFAETADVAFPLAPHASPVAGGAYLFPASAADLALGEYWAVNGCTHEVGAEGSQSFAYDLGVWGPDHADGTYSDRLPGKDGTRNNHFRVWGKGVHAMADGVVREAVNACPNNPAPLRWSDPAELAAKLQAQKTKHWGAFPNGGSGNHLYIQHGDEMVLYAHLQKGSLSSALLAAGAEVKAGDLLGKAGNSGSSTAPHLHVHAVQGASPESGPLRPLILRDAWAIDNDLVIGEPARGAWSRIAGQGIPEREPEQGDKNDCFVWPDRRLPEWPEIVELSVPEAAYQPLYERMAANGLRPVWIDAHNMSVNRGMGQTCFNVIFRPATGVSFHVRHGLSGNEYQAEFDKWVKEKKYRLTHVESYFSHSLGRTCYAAIFAQSPGPGFAAYHGRSRQEHQAFFDDFTKNKGLVPVNISVVSNDGERVFTALYEKRNAGVVEARANLTVAEYQQKFTDNARKGLHLAYLNSYPHEGGINFVAIWRQKLPPPYVEHHLDRQEFETLLKKERKAGLYLRAITGYQRGGTANWAAIWNR